MILSSKLSTLKGHFGVFATGLLTLSLLFSGCSSTGSGESTLTKSAAAQPSESETAASSNEEPDIPSSGESDATSSSSGEDLVIPISELSSTASFYTVEVDGTTMEIIAVIDSAGNIRTAFNTCQICYSSGRGYYVQSGDKLVCQNCGNQFTIDQIEIETGGCNPWPIFAENKTVTEDSVVIPYEFLDESRQIFARWKIAF